MRFGGKGMGCYFTSHKSDAVCLQISTNSHRQVPTRINQDENIHSAIHTKALIATCQLREISSIHEEK